MIKLVKVASAGLFAILLHSQANAALFSFTGDGTSVERELLSWRAPDDADLAAVVTPFARLEARVRRLDGDIKILIDIGEVTQAVCAVGRKAARQLRNPVRGNTFEDVQK